MKANPDLIKTPLETEPTLTPLQAAAGAVKIDTLKHLLLKGADVNGVSKANVSRSYTTNLSDYRSALNCAYDYASSTLLPHDFSIAEFLLQKGANLNLSISPHTNNFCRELVLNLKMRACVYILEPMIAKSFKPGPRCLLWIIDEDDKGPKRFTEELLGEAINTVSKDSKIRSTKAILNDV